MLKQKSFWKGSLLVKNLATITRRKVIFVDWYKVLSSDPCWSSILECPEHPLHEALLATTTRLFNREDDFIHEWMRGKISINEVISSLRLDLQLPFDRDYLATQIVLDCRLMNMNSGLLAILKELQKRAFVVLATDNMDYFWQHLQYSRNLSKEELVFAEKDSNVSDMRMFDDVLCSSEQGVLKRDSSEAFYGEWLTSHQLSFSDALLLDDLEVNCRLFRSAGGKAIQVDDRFSAQALCDLRFVIEDWFGS